MGGKTSDSVPIFSLQEKEKVMMLLQHLKEKGDASSSTSASDRAKTEKQAQERMKTWFEESRKKLAAAARGNANSATFGEERLSKKPMKYSTFEEESVFKNPKTSGDANSTH